MHRSGTSAITHGLEVMGVELGSNLMPPAEGNNEKGFFEDVEVNRLNIDLLAEFGQDWKTLAPVAGEELTSARTAPLRLRAIELLRSRFERTQVFGLKDPRM